MTRLVLVALLLVGCERKIEEAPPEAAAPAASPPAASEPAAAAPPSPVAAAPPSPVAPEPAKPPEPQGLTLSFDADEVGGPAAGVEAVIGDWMVGEADGARGLLVDGTRWRNGTPSANLADQAKRLYGDHYAEFLDGVKAFAFFPLAVVQQPPPAGNLRLSVRFYPIAGKIDQAAGIAFDIHDDGSYAVVRANALEDNILWARVKRGKRRILARVRNTATPTHAWHTLVVTLRGTEMTVELDGEQRYQDALEAVPHGRVGLWTKADSKVLFDDFRVELVE